MWFRISSLVLLVSILCLGFTAGDANAHGLKSAYLGSSVWEEGLSSKQINQELRDHFAEVIDRLKARNASSLLTALIRAEATSAKRWTKADRLAALIYLAHNRQQQIDRLHGYMNRGLFPLNQGQANSPVPIFVDRNQTHCAVGYLMHSAGNDIEVESIVNTNNLVRVAHVREGGMIDWIRTSGLTQEEAAMIQPVYPLDLDATFEDLVTSASPIERNGFIFSDATVRGSRFDAITPSSFADDPGALRLILEQGRAVIDTNDVVTPAGREGIGVVFGQSQQDNSFGSGNLIGPGNLSDFLYVGSTDELSGGLVGAARASGNVGIIEIEYQLRSERGNFSQIALTSQIESLGYGVFRSNNISGEGSAILLLSEIFEAGTDDLLGETMLSVVGTGVPDPNTAIDLVGSDRIGLDTDAIRVRTFGLVVGGLVEQRAPLHSFFHEFETNAVPEPSSVALVSIFGVVGVLRRRRI